VERISQGTLRDKPPKDLTQSNKRTRAPLQQLRRNKNSLRENIQAEEKGRQGGTPRYKYAMDFPVLLTHWCDGSTPRGHHSKIQLGKPWPHQSPEVGLRGQGKKIEVRSGCSVNYFLFLGFGKLSPGIVQRRAANMPTSGGLGFGFPLGSTQARNRHIMIGADTREGREVPPKKGQDWSVCNFGLPWVSPWVSESPRFLCNARGTTL
jgi:hypothetical protein